MQRRFLSRAHLIINMFMYATTYYLTSTAPTTPTVLRVHRTYY